MGVIETVGAVAVAVSSLLALIAVAIKRSRAKRRQRKADLLNELSIKIKAAKTIDEQIEYAKKYKDIIDS